MALILHLIPNYISEILFLINCNLIIKTGGISDFNDSVHLKNYDGNSEPCVIITCQKQEKDNLNNVNMSFLNSLCFSAFD